MVDYDKSWFDNCVTIEDIFMIINLKYYTYDCGTSTSVKEIYHLMILVIMEMLGMMKMTTILQFNDDGLMMLGITRTSGQGRPNCLEIPVSFASLPSTYHQRNVADGWQS